MSRGFLTIDSAVMDWADEGPPRSLIIPIVACLVVVFIVWAAFAKVDEVAVGSARVTPSSKSQLVQSLEGGIIEEIFVREGDLVQAGQKLAALDRARFMATVGETLAKARSLEAAGARLKAEIEGGMPKFSKEVEQMPELVAREMELLRSRRQNLQESSASLEESLLWFDARSR